MSDHRNNKAQSVYPVEMKHQITCDVWKDACWHVQGLCRISQAR